MPKVKCSDDDRLRTFVFEFGEDVFSTVDLVILCIEYGVKIASEKKIDFTTTYCKCKTIKGITTQRDSR